VKYTNYLINGKVINVNVLHTDKNLLKPVYMLGTVMIVVVSIAGITIVLPIAIFLDGYRTTKYKIIRINKRHFHFKTNYKFNFLSKNIPDISDDDVPNFDKMKFPDILEMFKNIFYIFHKD
jgi:hypothetical protein